MLINEIEVEVENNEDFAKTFLEDEGFAKVGKIKRLNGGYVPFIVFKGHMSPEKELKRNGFELEEFVEKVTGDKNRFGYVAEYQVCDNCKKVIKNTDYDHLFGFFCEVERTLCRSCIRENPEFYLNNLKTDKMMRFHIPNTLFTTFELKEMGYEECEKSEADFYSLIEKIGSREKYKYFRKK